MLILCSYLNSTPSPSILNQHSLTKYHQEDFSGFSFFFLLNWRNPLLFLFLTPEDFHWEATPLAFWLAAQNTPPSHFIFNGVLNFPNYFSICKWIKYSLKQGRPKKNLPKMKEVKLTYNSLKGNLVKENRNEIITPDKWC